MNIISIILFALSALLLLIIYKWICPRSFTFLKNIMTIIKGESKTSVLVEVIDTFSLIIKTSQPTISKTPK